MNHFASNLMFGIYCRNSTHDGPGDQLNACRELIAACSHYSSTRNVGEYLDDGNSANLLDRPGIKRLLADAEAGKLTVVIVRDLGRFSRDPATLVMLLLTLEDLGMVVVAVADEFCSDAMSHQHFFGHGAAS